MGKFTAVSVRILQRKSIDRIFVDTLRWKHVSGLVHMMAEPTLDHLQAGESNRKVKQLFHQIGR